MDKWLLMFVLGAILSLFLPLAPAIFYIVLCLVFAIACFFTKKLIYVSGLFLAIAWMFYNALSYQQIFNANVNNSNLAKNTLHKEAHIIQGKVISLITPFNGNRKLDTTGNSQDHENINQNLLSATPALVKKSSFTRFNVEVTQFDYLPLSKPMLVRLSWKNANLPLAQGNIIQLKVRLKPAHGFANEGAFNYQIWLRAKNIVATGYVLTNDENKQLVTQTTFRQQLFNQLTEILPEHPLRSLIFALALGDRSAITPSQWQVLKATGTQHLVAISGLHIGLVASGVFLVVIFVLKLLPFNWLSARYAMYLMQGNSRYIAIIISLLITSYYAMLSGFAIPTLRALLMLLTYWIARIFGVNISLKRWLLWVLTAVIILFPMSLLSASFWLSFYAVLVIFILLWRCNAFYHTTTKVTSDDSKHLASSSFSKMVSWRNKITAFVLSLVILQAGLSLFLLPVTLFFYQQWSVASFAANIIAVPWMSFTTIPLTLFAIMLLPINSMVAAYFFEKALKTLTLLWQWLDVLTQQPWGLLSLSEWQIMALMLVILSIMLVFVFRLKVIYLLYLLPFTLVFVINSSIKHSSLWQVKVFDVGHGLAVLIEKNGHAILYDTAARYPSGFNFVEAAILPYLQQRDIKQLDKVIISHDDQDHAGGLPILAQKLTIKELRANEAVSQLIANVSQISKINRPINNIKKVELCIKGRGFTWQSLKFDILSPNVAKGDHNDDSCVIRISDGQKSILLTGDISKKIERYLVKNHLIKPTDVLIAPHHGSKSASSHLFLQALQPKYAIFSSGYLNRWRMPVNSVLLRYRQQEISTYNTAENGMIEVNFFYDHIKLQTYRQDKLAYWFAN